MARIPPSLKATRSTADDYWSMLEEVTAGAFFWDPGADHVEWSPRLHASLGYSEAERATLTDIEALLHPDDVEPHRAVLAASMEQGESYFVEVRLRNASGAYQHFAVRGFWVARDGNLTAKLIGFLIEVTDVVELRQEAARAEKLFRAFFDNAPAAVYIKDGNFRHLYGNSFAAKLAGCSLEDFLQKPTPELFGFDTARALEEVDLRVLKGGETVTWHGKVDTESGESFYVFDTKFPIRDPLTDEPMVGGFGIDMTRQHQAERALARSQRLEAVGQLVAGIAHDFNNSLAVLQGNLDLIDMVETEQDVEECKSEMRNAIERGRRLTQQLLAYGRKALLNPEVLNLNAVIGEIDRLLRRALPESIRIETVLDGELWNTRLDRTEIENAILNLAINARDAMPGGGCLTIETANVRCGKDFDEVRTSELEPGRYVMLSVSDNGSGMDAEVAERAFDPFFTTKPINKGTGMGLAMVYGLMKQLGGTARLQSVPGAGASVKLYVPAAAEDIPAAEPPGKTPSQGSEHLLLVEDEHAVRKTLLRQLQQLGYLVTEASNGADAYEILLADPSIDLLITDIVMPGDIQGPRLAAKARETLPDLPVLFMSGYPLEAAVHGNGLRSDDVSLTKPVALADLADSIRRRLK